MPRKNSFWCNSGRVSFRGLADCMNQEVACQLANAQNHGTHSLVFFFFLFPPLLFDNVIFFLLANPVDQHSLQKSIKGLDKGH